MKAQPQLPTAPVSAATPCPVLAAAKSPLKALKKLRRQERRRFFISWCEGLRALGFSF